MYSELRIVMLCFGLFMSSTLWGSEGETIEQCLKAGAEDRLQQCETAAFSVASNALALESLGKKLEAQLRYQEAMLVYQIGSDEHTHNKRLLQNLIKARAAWRQQKTSFRSSHTRVSSTTGININEMTNQENTTNSDINNIVNSLSYSGHQQKENKPNASVSASSEQNGHTAVTTNRQRSAVLNTGKSYALIIGNNNYRARDFPDLYTAVNDAKKIANVLKKNYGFQTKLLLNADRYQTMAAISALRKSVRQQDKVLIYYAGHGVLDEVTNRGYWLPTDAESNNIANWISSSDVTDVLAGIAAQHALVIADSCFSGSLLRNGAQTNLDERNTLLVRLNSKKSRTVMTSGGLEPVQDDGGGKHSVFAGVLIKLLQQNASVLEAERLFVQLRDQVILKADQTPQYAPIRKAGHDGGDFIFVPI